MTISKRLLVLMLSAMLSLCVVSGVNLYQMNLVYDEANFGNENVVPSVLLLDDALKQFSQVRVRKYRHILNTESALQKSGNAYEQMVCTGNLPHGIPEKLK